MFVGHYAAALAAKAVEPRGPLWTYVIGAQLIDIGWSALVIGGVEKMRVDETLPGSPLDLFHMPYTHSLPACILWALAAALLARYALRLDWRPAVFVGLTVFSHWLLDFLVHRPDLALWFSGPKVGLALWNYPVPEQAIEIGILGLAAAAWAWVRGRDDRSLWPVLTFTGLLVTLQIVVLLMPANPDPAGMGASALAVYLAAGLVAFVLDRPQRRA